MAPTTTFWHGSPVLPRHSANVKKDLLEKNWDSADAGCELGRNRFRSWPRGGRLEALFSQGAGARFGHALLVERVRIDVPAGFGR